jgi:thiol-disulfide isomerase/thioredoxin
VDSVLYIGVMPRPRTHLAILALFVCAISASAGDAAPSLALQDLKGAPHKLEEFRGKPVVLNFWATWCVPCAAEMPLLSELQTQYKDKILFIAASIDDDDVKPEIPAFIKKHKGDALTVMTGATFDNLTDFGVGQVMPGTIFIDAEGNIVDRVSGALKRDDLETRLQKLAAGTLVPTPTPPPARKPTKDSTAAKQD